MTVKIPQGIYGTRRADCYGYSRIEVGIDIDELRWTCGQAKLHEEARLAEMPPEPQTPNDWNRRQQSEKRVAYLQSVIDWTNTVRA